MTGNKINWQDLAAELATRTGMQRKDADAFVRAFFDTLGKEIKEEKSVKVKALGTFKMVEVQEREPGQDLPFEAVRGAVQHALRQQTWVTALRQCLQLLAAEAQLEGVELDEAASPLVQ